jgi:hypothetical protein
MKRGQDIAVELPGLYLVHHNLPGKRAEPHAHGEHLLSMPLQGEIGVRISHPGGSADGRELSCGPGRMIYLPPKTQHSFTSSMMAGERLIAIFAPGPKGAESCVLPASQLCKELLFHLLLHPAPAAARPFVAAFRLALAQALSAREEVGTPGLEHLEAKAADPRIQRALAALRAGVGGKLAMDRVARAAG